MYRKPIAVSLLLQLLVAHILTADIEGVNDTGSSVSTVRARTSNLALFSLAPVCANCSFLFPREASVKT